MTGEYLENFPIGSEMAYFNPQLGRRSCMLFIGIHCNDFCEIFQDYGTLLVTKTDNNEYLAPDRGQQVYSLYQAEGNELAIKAGKKRER